MEIKDINRLSHPQVINNSPTYIIAYLLTSEWKEGNEYDKM